MNKITVRAAGKKKAEVLIYEQIGAGFFEEGVTAKSFAKELKALGEVDLINVRINSPGGSVFEGTTIYNTLKNHKARIEVDIDGAALSIASVIAMAGDEVRMASNALLMIHDPEMIAIGRAEDMEKAAEILAKTRENIAAAYVQKTGKEQSEILALMGDETWFDAQEAKEAGFVDKVTGELKIAAHFNSKLVNSVPGRFLDRFMCTAEAEKPQETQKKEPDMAETTAETTKKEPETTVSEPKNASYEQIVNACDGADPTFICAQLAAKATVGAAQNAWMKEQNARIQAQKQEIEQVKASGATKSTRPGVDPLTSTKAAATEATADPIEAFNDAVALKVKAGMNKQRAMAAAVKENPELHRNYLSAYNVANGRKALI